jgi:hypothetical protein
MPHNTALDFFARGQLVKIHLRHYRQSMSLKKHFALPALIFCAAATRRHNS